MGIADWFSGKKKAARASGFLLVITPPYPDTGSGKGGLIFHFTNFLLQNFPDKYPDVDQAWDPVHELTLAMDAGKPFVVCTVPDRGRAEALAAKLRVPHRDTEFLVEVQQG